MSEPVIEIRSTYWRIDYQIASPGLADRAVEGRIERVATHAERWSDHAPVTVTYDHKV